MSKPSFEQRYQENNIPWDRPDPDYNLINIIRDFSIHPGRVLDLGCGTGINSVWLAQQGFKVAGIDLSPTAIQKSKARALEQNVTINLFSGDFLTTEIPGPFDFIFDRGCLHCFNGTEAKVSYVKKVAELLPADGLWLSLIGNADDVPRDVGPPTMSASEISIIVEPHFEILSLSAGYFGGEQNDPPKAWIALMKKRDNA